MNTTKHKPGCPRVAAEVAGDWYLPDCTCPDTVPSGAQAPTYAEILRRKQRCLDEPGNLTAFNDYTFILESAHRAKCAEVENWKQRERAEWQRAQNNDKARHEALDSFKAEKQRADRLAEYCRSIQKPLGEIECAFHNRIRSERAFEKFGGMVDQIRCGLAELLAGD